MKKTLFFFCMAFISFAAFSQTTVWNPAGNNPSDGLWTTAANWTNGVPVEAGKAVFNVPNAMDCTLDAIATIFEYRQGDNGPGGTLIIKNGASLTTGNSWAGIGHNNPAELIIEAGGSLSLGSHAWIGHVAGGVGVVDVSGTFNIAGMTGLGWNGGAGFVTVNTGGVMNCSQFGNASIKGSSVLDIKGGTVNMTGDKTGDVNAYIASGHIVAYGGGGTLNVEVVGGNTVITSNADVTAPTIVGTIPADEAVDIPPVTNIKIEFSESMNTSSVEGAVTITPDIANKAFAWDGNTLTITGDDMATSQAYTVTIGTAASDINGNALASAYSFGFTTAAPIAIPVVVQTVPADQATGVDADLDVVINFSKSMNTATVEAAVTSVPAIENATMAWTNDDKTLTISGDRLIWESQYTVTVAAGAEAADATALADDAVFSFTVKAQPLTTIKWAPATDGSSDGLWTTAVNWNLNEVADGNYKVVFSGGGEVSPSHLNSPVTISTLVMGDGGPGGDSLVIESGGILNTMEGWSAIGYNRDATMVIEAGGEVNFASHAWIPLNDGEAKVDIYGTFNIGEMTGIGWVGGTGYVTVYTGGVMNCSQFGNASIKGSSVLDIKGGTVNLTGDKTGDVNAYIASGHIVAYGGGGTLNVNLVDGNTVITSNADVIAPTIVGTLPADGAVDVPPVASIQIEFSELMNASSVEGAVTITPDIANKVFAWDKNTLTITGDEMTTLQAYTVTIGTAASDINDNTLASAYSFGFTTADPDAPPVVVQTVPADQATGVEADLDVVINFSKIMNTANVEAAVTSVPAIENVTMTWTNNDKTLTISGDRLIWESQYTVTVAAGAEAADGTVLAAEVVFGFTVKAQPLTTIKWAPATDGSSDSLWTTAVNWDLDEVADGNYKVVFNGGGPVPPSHLNAPVTISTLVMGDGGPGGDSLVVENGGILNTMTGWSAIGYNRDATMVIEAGGEVNFASHAWIPLNDGAAKVDIYGTFNVGQMTGLGWRGGNGTVNIFEGGVMNCAQFAGMDGDASIKDGSVLNIEGGTLVITGNVSAIIAAYADAGRITAFGGTGTLRVSQADGKTTITSVLTANTDATLSSITIDDGAVALDPAFDAGTYTYTAVAHSDSTSVTVRATANDPYAKVSGDGVVDLSTGSGTATIVVTAEDGTTELTYTVAITVDPTSVSALSRTKINALYMPKQDLIRLENAASVEMIKVIDITGKVMINSKGNHSETIEIGTAELSSGLFIIQMKLSDNQTQSVKFVK